MNKLLFEQLSAFADDSAPASARLSNMLACLYWSDPQISWAGLYRTEPVQSSDSRIDPSASAVLDCFQGKPACMVIAPHKAVIGAAIDQKAPVCVDDVHTFPGHIACDPSSRSELAIPLFHNEAVIAVLDLDSDVFSHFHDLSQAGIQRLGRLFEDVLMEKIREDSFRADPSSSGIASV